MYYDIETKSVFKYLKIALIFVLLGRAFQYLYWDAPFRAFFWDQNLLKPVVNFFGYSWDNYATSFAVNAFIENLIIANGIFFLIVAVALFFKKIHTKKWFRKFIFITGVLLILLAFLQTKDKFYQLAMFFEHTIQFSLPFFILFAKKIKKDRLIFLLKISIALTFLCHGLYAIGLYPIPENFVTMTIHILPLDESQARLFLYIVGILDFIIAFGIFIPKLTKSIILYAAFWGFTTALARIIHGLLYDVSFVIISEYLYLTVYRLSHGIVPLAVYLIIKSNHKKQYINS